MNSDPQRMEKIVSLCKRRGFIFQASEIYGGLNGVWDYGPLGVELKRNLSPQISQISQIHSGRNGSGF